MKDYWSIISGMLINWLTPLMQECLLFVFILDCCFCQHQTALYPFIWSNLNNWAIQGGVETRDYYPFDILSVISDLPWDLSHQIVLSSRVVCVLSWCLSLQRYTPVVEPWNLFTLLSSTRNPSLCFPYRWGVANYIIIICTCDWHVH